MVGLVCYGYPINMGILTGNKVGVEGFGGNLWPNRFIGFVVGMVSYIFLTSYFFNEHLTPKISVQLILCFFNPHGSTIVEELNIYKYEKDCI